MNTNGTGNNDGTDSGVGPGPFDDAMLLRAHEEDYPWPSPWMATFLRGLRAQPNVSAAARLAGVTPQATYVARDRDPLFAAVWDDAKKQSVDLLAGFAHRLATTGLPQGETRTTVKRALVDGRMVVTEESTVTVEGTLISPQMAMFLLRAHDPRQYVPPERRELTGGDGGPVQVHAVHRVPSEERVLELARIAVEQAEADAQTVDHDGEPRELGPGE